MLTDIHNSFTDTFIGKFLTKPSLNMPIPWPQQHDIHDADNTGYKTLSPPT